MGGHTHDHDHDHSRDHPHAHVHGVVDPSIVATARGIRAVQWSLLIMLVTGVAQLAVVAWSGSVALLSDSFHNVSDAFTAVPLWVAFAIARRKPSPRFGYGYGRVEDLAGLAIVATIFSSAGLAGWESFRRLLEPEAMRLPGAVAAAALVGFAGNELVARLRIRVGREIGSAALVADGNHARVDALTSLAVLLGAAGAWLGFPMADPIVGLAIAAAILRIAWESGRTVVGRLLDEVDPALVDAIAHEALHVPGVREVARLRVRWIGHRLDADLSVGVAPELSLGDAHGIALAVERRLLEKWPQLGHVGARPGPVGGASSVAAPSLPSVVND